MALSYPLRILVLSIAGRLNQQQGQVLEHAVDENRVLAEQLEDKALRLNTECIGAPLKHHRRAA